MSARNPITERLDVLHNQWTAFAKRDEARLLRWLANADEVALIDTFLVKESEPDTCETPDMFVRFDEAFELPDAHGFVLRESFIKTYDALRDELAAQGEAPFTAPHAQREDDDVRAFMRVMHAFQAHQKEQIALLVVALMPESVRDPHAYQLWLHRLVREAPPELRILVVDSVEAPSLEPLAETEPLRVISERCGLDMPGALVELSRQNLDTPGAQLRHLLVLLTNAAKDANLSVAAPLAANATQFATALGWPHLAAVAQLVLAGIYTQLAQPLEALRCYAEVDRLGELTYAKGDESAEQAALQDGSLTGQEAKTHGLTLRRDARFGQGATLLSQHVWGQAARVYLDAASLSKVLAEPRAELDALRLASFAYEQEGKVHEAWQCGMKGLEAGAAMDDDTRHTSTLGYLGDAMLRLTEQSEYAAHRQPIYAHIEALLGAGWREKLVTEA